MYHTILFVHNLKYKMENQNFVASTFSCRTILQHLVVTCRVFRSYSTSLARKFCRTFPLDVNCNAHNGFPSDPLATRRFTFFALFIHRSCPFICLHWALNGEIYEKSIYKCLFVHTTQWAWPWPSFVSSSPSSLRSLTLDSFPFVPFIHLLIYFHFCLLLILRFQREQTNSHRTIFPSSLLFRSLHSPFRLRTCAFGCSQFMN